MEAGGTNMSEHTVTLTIPTAIYDHLKRRAEASKRTVQDEIVELLLAQVPVESELPADLAGAIAPLSLFNDEELWRAARSRFPAEDAAELEELHHKREREGLSEEEARTLAGLVRRYERSMLVRAQAAALLKQRGHDVSELLKAS